MEIQITEWKPKYYPDNILGDEVAIFKLYDDEITIERDDYLSIYSFELDEPVLIDKNKSVSRKIHNFLNDNNIQFMKVACELIETE
ncbi:MAG: hypothetical protein GY705_13565 [Bacteroidetes bacterium]|nr:hypothetical protein [Bacteroidota bacterium]